MKNQSAIAIPVLLVEDNEIDVEITKRVLARSGLNVRLDIATNGEEALDLLARRNRDVGPLREEAALPRLILLDLRLPGVDGREVLRRIKNDPELCSIPVAVLTGSTDQRPMMECMAIGGNMYFVKPITASDALNIMTVVQKYWVLIENLSRRRAER